MKKIELFIIPYPKENEVKTRLIVDGNKINSKDNRLTNLVVYQPMRKWLNPYKKKLFIWEGLLAEVVEEFNDKAIHFIFHGCKADYTLFKKSILVQQMKLNRNGGAVDVSFELIDKWNPKKTAKELAELLDDLRIEADNWGEDEIIKEIDCLTDIIGTCKVTPVFKHFPSSAEFQNLLQTNHIKTSDHAVLTVIPVSNRVPSAEIRKTITTMLETAETDRNYIVVNTSPQDNSQLLDRVMPFDTDINASIKYIENDGEDYIKEIEKVYYLFVLPRAIEKASEILLMFPDHNINNFLIDIADKIEDLFYVKF